MCVCVFVCVCVCTHIESVTKHFAQMFGLVWFGFMAYQPL